MISIAIGECHILKPLTISLGFPPSSKASLYPLRFTRLAAQELLDSDWGTSPAHLSALANAQHIYQSHEGQGCLGCFLMQWPYDARYRLKIFTKTFLNNYTSARTLTNRTYVMFLKQESNFMQVNFASTNRLQGVGPKADLEPHGDGSAGRRSSRPRAK